MLKLFNTLTRQKDDFTPITDIVRMYSCGPTVYSYAHIGNLRTYIFMDLIRRTLKYNGYKIKGVINITDVGHLMADSDDGEDKMVKASREQKKSPLEIAALYTEIFFNDLKKLNIETPEIVAKATDHIPDMISYVEQLLDKGYGYQTSDGIYFDIGKFSGYGQLSGANLDDQIAGARVEVNSEKRHPADFAIWKKADPLHIMQWTSPWGMGYPGWHIECSAMSRKYLGDVFDIHSGGVDHIPIHHENEIAQNEALTEKRSVNYWLHGEFMLVDGGKMSKSLGNTYTVANLEERGYSALDFRFFCLNAHYRKKLNFTFESLDAAKVARNRLMATLQEHKLSTVTTDTGIISNYITQFVEAINDDLNVPLALGILFTASKEPKSIDIYNLALHIDRVLGLSLDCLETKADLDIPTEISALLDKRALAKANKDYAAADGYRKQIEAFGYAIKDTASGAVVTKK